MAGALIRAGASLIIMDINIDKAKEVAKKLISSTSKVIAIKVDIDFSKINKEDNMNSKERVVAALNLMETDKVPFLDGYIDPDIEKALLQVQELSVLCFP